MHESLKEPRGLPVGCDDYGEVVDNQLIFVDKSLFIQAILKDKSEVILITRPRRFGKTLNMSLLHYFFAAEVLNRKTEGMFDHLQIAQYPACMAHQGQYPVISITFKDLKADTYELFYALFCDIIRDLYTQHMRLLSHPTLQESDQERFKAILNGTANETVLRFALRDLTRYLYQRYQVKPIVLIDEYDAPIQAGYQYDYYEKAIQLMRGVLSPVLKNNAYLKKAVLTGVLRVAKEGMFSGLNNVKVYSVLNHHYSDYFGFTDSEVDQLLEKSGLSGKKDEVKTWYNGYQIGNTWVYNPWSIINYLHEHGTCAAYWLNTSDNQWLKDLVIKSNVKVKAALHQLLEDKSIQVLIPDNFVFADLKRNTATLWSLFVMAGYLTVTESTLVDAELWSCRIEIPNYEVRAIYLQIIRQWVSDNQGPEWYQDFIQHLLTGNIEAWAQEMQEVMIQMTSYHDSAMAAEAFYHGMLLGICSPLQGQGYIVKSNQESGMGRYDIALIPHDPQQLGIIIELKHADVGKHATEQETEEALVAAAEDGLTQIQNKEYAAGLRQAGVGTICAIGVGFHGKQLHIQHAFWKADQ